MMADRVARRGDLDRVKGLAILLVVFGHLVARADPSGVHWYEPLRRAVYSFHMPLFLYVSGVVSVLSGHLLAPPSQYRQVLLGRAKRLLLPFFGLGLLVVAGKFVLARVMFVDHPPAGFACGLLDLFWHTGQSPALSLWYLFVLFTVGALSMLVLRGGTARLPLLLAGAALLYLLNLPAYCYLDRVGSYALFYVLGVWAGFMGEKWEALLQRWWQLALAVFCSGLGLMVWLGASWPQKPALLLFGMLSMPAIHGAMKHSALSSSRILLSLGRYSFVIYLFNTLFIGLAKGILLHSCDWNGPNFVLFAGVLMASGVLGPLALKYAFLRFSPALDRMTS